jgi:hypothetical protein
MSNHYSPHDDAEADRRKKNQRAGERMKELISTRDPAELAGWLYGMRRRFRKVEQHVIGRDAMRELGIIEAELGGVFEKDD